jgi:hypothetical protein
MVVEALEMLGFARSNMTSYALLIDVYIMYPEGTT